MNFAFITSVFSVTSVALFAVVFQVNGPASLLVDAPQDKEGFKIQLADTLKITITVDGPVTLVVQPPGKITKSAGWRLAQVTPAATMDTGKDGKRWQQDFVFEALAPQALTLQIEPFEVGEAQGPFRKITWKPIAVQVHTSITMPDLKSLRDPTVIEPLPPADEDQIDPWLSVAASFFLAALAVLTYIWWRRRNRKRPVLARQWALHELDRLLALHLPDKNKVEGFHTLLANVVRRYLEREFQLPARRRTTAEFLEVLLGSPKLSGPRQEFLRDFLHRCDLAKFAGAAVTPQECAVLAQKARDFIEGV